MFSLIAVVHLMSQSALAKDACSGVKVERDAFANQEVASAKGLVKSKDWTIGWDARLSGGTASITFTLPAHGAVKEALAPGYALKLLMQDGSVQEIATAKETEPKYSAIQTGVFTQWNAEFSLDKAQLTSLAAQPILAVRASLPSGDATWESKKGIDFKNVFGCFAERMQ